MDHPKCTLLEKFVGVALFRWWTKLSGMKNSEEETAGEIGDLSDSQYIIAIIFHLSSWREVMGDSDKSRDG